MIKRYNPSLLLISEHSNMINIISVAQPNKPHWFLWKFKCAGVTVTV